MTKQLIGLNCWLYVFNLSEADKYRAYKAKFDGYYTERFINNQLAIEVKKTVIK